MDGWMDGWMLEGLHSVGIGMHKYMEKYVA